MFPAQCFPIFMRSKKKNIYDKSVLSIVIENGKKDVKLETKNNVFCMIIFFFFFWIEFVAVKIPISQTHARIARYTMKPLMFIDTMFTMCVWYKCYVIVNIFHLAYMKTLKYRRNKLAHTTEKTKTWKYNVVVITQHRHFHIYFEKTNQNRKNLSAQV